MTAWTTVSYTHLDVYKRQEVNGRLTGALVNEDQHMIDLVLGRTDRQIVTVEQAVMGIEFCQLLIQSCDSGRIVERS